jgi:hypothetical protein
MAAPGVVLYKHFTWRGEDEEWGNTYHFLGDAPGNPADWRSLVDDLVALEKDVLLSSVHIGRAICYEDTDDNSVYSYDLSAFGGEVAGTIVAADEGGHVQEGGSSYQARWDTGRRSTKGKPIYLRKYWHPALDDGTPDVLNSYVVGRVATFAEDVLAASGDWPGLAGPDHNAPVGHLALTYVGYRDLRKGRRRPT